MDGEGSEVMASPMDRGNLGRSRRGGDLLAAAIVLRGESIRICLNRALIEDRCGVHIDKRHCEPLHLCPT